MGVVILVDIQDLIDIIENILSALTSLDPEQEEINKEAINKMIADQVGVVKRRVGGLMSW